jgi:hypothetical protein
MINIAVSLARILPGSRKVSPPVIGSPGANVRRDRPGGSFRPVRPCLEKVESVPPVALSAGWRRAPSVLIP